MFRILFQIFFIIVVSLTAIGFVNGQNALPSRNGDISKEDLPKGIQETFAKQRIAREKKDFAELLERGEEAVKISDELEKSFTQTNQLSLEDRKKIDRLEKLVKKIRSEIGADKDTDDVALEDKPSSVNNALKSLQNNAVKLIDELKKTTRHSISVVAVESSNLLLKVVRFLRLGKN